MLNFLFNLEQWFEKWSMLSLVVIAQVGRMGDKERRGEVEGTLRPTKRKFVRSTNASGRATKRQVDSLFICVHSSIDTLLFLIFCLRESLPL